MAGEAAVDGEEPPVSGCRQGLAMFIGLCYWAMLAASTIGPGTITLMSRGGAEFKLQLCWTIPLASVIAYCLQEAGARLQILQNTSFGGAMRIHFQSLGTDPPTDLEMAAVLDNDRMQVPSSQEHEGEAPEQKLDQTEEFQVLEQKGDDLDDEPAELAEETEVRGRAESIRLMTTLPTPLISRAIAVMVVIANTFLECAQFAGLMAAIEYYVGTDSPAMVIVRIAGTFAFCALVALVLFKGDVDKISKALGVVVVVMTVTFGISAAQTGLDFGDLLMGQIPQLPTGSSPQALGMIATTALPFNIFLASTLAEGRYAAAGAGC